MAKIEKSPLFVDLDGTLIKTDLLMEAALTLLKRNPLWFFPMLWWLLAGKAVLKSRLADRIQVDPEALPYHPQFLDFLKREADAGRPLILATGADRKPACRIAAHLGFFQDVLASDAKVNLTGPRKWLAIQNRMGNRPFTYAGDSHCDLAVWRHSQAAIVVNGSRRLLNRVSALVPVSREFPPGRSRYRALLEGLRIHQWIKNSLVFVPLLAAHRLMDFSAWWYCIAAFFSFSFLSSSVYLINDLFDLQSDRLHHRKKNRPFASGDLPVRKGLQAVPLLVLFSLCFAFPLPASFVQILVLYFLVTTLYSIFLKAVAWLDVLILASLFTLRIYSGAHAIQVPVSSWLLGFSMCLFLSLAFLKRYAEVFRHRGEGTTRLPGRGYGARHAGLVWWLGLLSGFMSVLVLVFYIHSPSVFFLYEHPLRLWFLCPVLLFWILWLWSVARRGGMKEDPILFAIGDPMSYLVGSWGTWIVYMAS